MDSNPESRKGSEGPLKATKSPGSQSKMVNRNLGTSSSATGHSNITCSPLRSNISDINRGDATMQGKMRYRCLNGHEVRQSCELPASMDPGHHASMALVETTDGHEDVRRRGLRDCGDPSACRAPKLPQGGVLGMADTEESPAEKIHAVSGMPGPMATIYRKSSKYSSRLPFDASVFYGELPSNFPVLSIDWPPTYAKVFGEIESCLHFHGYTTFLRYVEDELLLDLIKDGVRTS